MTITLTAKEIASLVGVSPRSTGRAGLVLDSIKERAFAEARYNAGLPSCAALLQVGSTAQRLQHVTDTGRISGAALCDFREMRPYTVCGLVALLSEQLWSELLDDEACAVIRDGIATIVFA